MNHPDSMTGYGVELLAPAGGYDSLVAAVNNGADAVYLGLRDLNARRGAENFEIESLTEATRFAHLRGVRVYLTANVLVLPHELEGALDLVDEAWAAGVDAVIVQDLGLLRAVARHLPAVRLHASTQIDAMNSATVEALLELGVSRVTLARETSIADIAGIHARLPAAELESFVHGALCICYSGQCLMSSLIGQRSANRGQCAQPCRLPYTLQDAEGKDVAEPPGRYLLSPRDVAGIAHLPALLRSGVAALKIEGRMKAPEYVAVVTGVYRRVLDRALSDLEVFEVTAGEWALLEEAFNRGFTDAYLTGAADESLMAYARPNNRGVHIGRVSAAPPGSRPRIELDRALQPRDTIEVWTRSGRFAQAAGVLRVDGREAATAPAGATVELSFERQVSAGDRVFRVANAEMLDAARRTFAGTAAVEHAALPVDVAVDARQGKPLRVAVATRDGHRAEAVGPVVEPARTKPIGVDEVIEHVGRFGGSGYTPGSWDVTVEPGVGLGYSALHATRRSALEALDEARLAPWAGRARVHPRLAQPAGGRAPAGIELVASVWDAEAARVCLSSGVDRALVRVAAVEPISELPSGAEALLPRVAREADVAPLMAWAESSPVTVGNLGVLRAVAPAGAASADWPLNVTNAESAGVVSELGARMVWASPELTRTQLAEVARRSPIPVGSLVYGRAELMVTEHCVLRAAGACSQRCETCERRGDWWRLRDVKGYEFPVTTDADGRTHVMNSATLDLVRVLGEVLSTGVSAIRLDFSDEPIDRVAEVTSTVREALDAVLAGGAAPEVKLAENTTSGHFFRGVR